MITVYDVDANKLIDELKEMLKTEKKIISPDWMQFVKTGSHTQRPPTQDDFWYIRASSILRQIYVNDIVGITRLRRHFGGSKNRGVKPSRKRLAGGSIIRKLLIQLEEAGFVEKTKQGRKLTGKGRAILDKAARNVSSR